MTKQGAHPPGMETFQPDPRPAIPTQLQASLRLWLLAVAAGLFETALVVVDATDGEIGSAAQVAVGVAVRLLVFTAAVYLAIQLRQGRNWARVALAVLYGGLGTGSLVIGPVTWLAEGDRWPTLWPPPTWGRCCSRPAGSCTWARSSRRCS
jgi:hypothetical protein